MTDRDIEYLPAAVIGALRCPEPGCGRHLVRTVDITKGKRLVKAGGWCCPVLGHGLMQGDDTIQQLVKALVPKAIREFDPQRSDYIWQYVLKRGREMWASDEQIELARNAGSWPKARKR